MGTYLIIYSIVTFLFWFSTKVKKSQRKYVEYFAIFILCMLAGLRAEGVGTDTVVYFRPLIRAAMAADSYGEYVASSWTKGWSIDYANRMETGFRLIVFIFAKLFYSPVVVQFVVQLLIVVPVYAALKRRNDIPLWFGMLVYMLIFNNLSFNAIRQCIAMSFTLLALQIWVDGNKKKSIVTLIVGCLFHTSGFLGFGTLLLYEFVQRDRKRALRFGLLRVDARYANMFLVLTAGALFLVGSNVVAAILEKISLSKYAGYISGDVRFMPNQLIKMLPPLLLMIVNFKYMDKTTDMARFYFSAVVITALLLQFTSVNPFGGRVADFFMYFGILSYPQACKRGKLTGLFTLAMVGYLLYYWFFYFGFGNSAETIPYISVFS